MKIVDNGTKAVACVGAINWGLIGLFDFNLVSALFGTRLVTQGIYIAVAACGLYQGFLLFKKSLEI